jgi:hypothetical protein
MEKDLLSRMDDLLKELAELMKAKENSPLCLQQELREMVNDDTLFDGTIDRYHREEELLTRTIEVRKKELEPLIIEQACTINSDSIQAVYSAPKPSWKKDALPGYAVDHPELMQISVPTWNEDSLEAYAVAHPEIRQFQEPGEPRISYRLKR